MKIVLFQPQIPQNTGNIGRLCVATNTPLYLLRPLGFFIHSKELKRAGLDYWERLDWQVVGSLEEIQKENPPARFWYFSKTGKKSYTKASYREQDILVFGNETEGLPADLLAANPDSVLTIPMWGLVRSLNLATAAGIALYEAYRQVGKGNFPG